MIELRVYRTHTDIKLPQHATQESACFDIAFQAAGKGNRVTGYSSMNKPINRIMNKALTISPGDRMLVPTGLIFDIPKGYSVRIHARSGLSLKQGLVLANAEGVIDSDYIEELFVMIHNISENPITINEGDRIAQGELVKNVEFEITQTVMRPLPRGNRVGGLGSTGVGTIAKITEDHGAVVINIPDDNLKSVSEELLNIEKVDVAVKDPYLKTTFSRKKIDPEKEHSLKKRRSRPSHRSTEIPTKDSVKPARPRRRKKLS